MVNLETVILHLGMLRKGKALRAPWVVLLRKDPVLCRPLPAIGHMWCSRVEDPPGAGVGDPPLSTPPDASKSTEDMVKALKLLQNVMTEEDFSKYEKMVMLPLPKKVERKKLREEELWRQCQKEENLKKKKKSSGAS